MVHSSQACQIYFGVPDQVGPLKMSVKILKSIVKMTENNCNDFSAFVIWSYFLLLGKTLAAAGTIEMLFRYSGEQHVTVV